MGDFLHRNASTPFAESFFAAGAHCRISTNSVSVLEAARKTFCPIGNLSYEREFSMRLWIDPTFSGEPSSRPYLRGRNHLIYAGFGAGNFAAIDLGSRRIVGRFSNDLAGDPAYWDGVIFPMFMSVMAATIGAAELHGACVAQNNRGVIICGPSHSGKSTLSLALASLGFGFLSDDRIFCFRQGETLMAWSPLTELKLRTEAVAWFPELSEAGRNQNRELRLDPEAVQFVRRSRVCEPHCLIFLEPKPSSGFRLLEISRGEAELRLCQDLLAENPEAANLQQEILDRLREIPAAILQYSDDPLTTARNLVRHLESPPRQQASAAGWATLTRATIEREDPLRRFVRAPFSREMSVMGKRIAIESNNEEILLHMQDLCSIYPPAEPDTPDFHWSIVSEPEKTTGADPFRRFAFSDPGLRFVQFGQRNVSVIDLDSRSAVAFVTEETARNKVTFTAPFLDSLFCCCASSLGFLPLFANCVSIDGKGILILGPPGSGKTSASYVAAKAGLHLHCDEGTFLELRGESLRAWGGFWPIMFRNDATKFFPELAKIGHAFSYLHFDFHHVEKKELQIAASAPVTPVACVFLERRPVCDVGVAKIRSEDLYRRLAASLLFEEEERFREQAAAVLRRIAMLPAFQITYGPDPAMAAAAVQELMAIHAS